jgi:hypothetical protein
MDNVIPITLYVFYLKAGIPYEGWVDFGDGKLAWAHLEANIYQVPYTQSNARFLKIVNTPVCITIDVLDPNVLQNVNSKNNLSFFNFNPKDLLKHIRFYVDVDVWDAKHGEFGKRKEQVPFSKLSLEQQEILRTFACSPNGKEFLSNYVNGGQDIGGVILSGKTKLNQYLDIYFDTGAQYVGYSAFQRVGLSDVVFDKDSFTMEIKIDKGYPKAEKVVTIGHEAFLHAEKMTKILLEKLRNEMPQEQKENLRKLFPAAHQDHQDFLLNKGEASKKFNQYLDYLKVKYENSNEINKAISNEIKDDEDMVRTGK